MMIVQKRGENTSKKPQ